MHCLDSTLFIKKENVVLSDNETISSLGINEDHLIIEMPKILLSGNPNADQLDKMDKLYIGTYGTDKLYIMPYDEMCTVLEIKKALKKFADIKIEDQKILFGEKELKDEKTLMNYKIDKENELILIKRISNCGGGVS